MSDIAFAAERAEQLFKEALDNKELNKWQSDLRRIAGLLRDATLLKKLEDASVSVDEKAKLLSERLVDASAEAIKLVSELMVKGKLSEIDEIADEYRRLMDSYHGIEGTETGEITTAIALDDDYVLDIAKRLTKMTGKPVTLKAKVDPEIIGGIIIKVGDKLIDGSIRTRLAGLKKNLDSAVR